MSVDNAPKLISLDALTVLNPPSLFCRNGELNRITMKRKWVYVHMPANIYIERNIGKFVGNASINNKVIHSSTQYISNSFYQWHGIGQKELQVQGTHCHPVPPLVTSNLLCNRKNPKEMRNTSIRTNTPCLEKAPLYLHC